VTLNRSNQIEGARMRGNNRKISVIGLGVMNLKFVVHVNQTAIYVLFI
jgi:hypothetical protein